VNQHVGYDNTENGGTDAFLSILSSDGASLVYSTFFGGAASDFASGIAVDDFSDAYMSGLTEDSGSAATNLPTTAGAFDTAVDPPIDSFVAKFGMGTLNAFAFRGFLSPVDVPPTVNVAKAGQTIPVKWQIPDGHGSYIRNLSIVTATQSRQVSCANFVDAYADAVEAYSTGGSSLRYDTASEQYIFNWQTTKSMASNCFVFILRLNDATQHLADFQMKK
jgi:hypothetical protein